MPPAIMMVLLILVLVGLSVYGYYDGRYHGRLLVLVVIIIGFYLAHSGALYRS